MEERASTVDMRAFLSALASPRPFVVLGAGSSVPLVPTTAELRGSIRRDFAGLGCWPVGNWQTSASLSGVFSDFDPETPEDLLLLSNAGRLDLFLQKALTVSFSRSAPQFEVFKWCSPGATLFNYNLDGLATYHVGGRLPVFTPHGSIDREWTTSPEVTSYLECSLDFDWPSLRPKILPGPEPTTVTRDSAFQYARTALTSATAVAIIGYSFALNPLGRLNDSESFEYFIDAQTSATCPVFVVNDRPTPLIDRLRDRLKSNRVRLIRLRWDLFSSAILPLLRTHCCPR